MSYHNYRGLVDIAEDFGESTSAGHVQRWVVGVGLASLVMLYSTICMVNQHAFFLQSRPLKIIELHGFSAVSVGGVYFAAALFMHCHWFWSAHPVYYGYGQLGKIVSLVGILGGLGCLFYNFLFLS
jgi:hypothetical protein